MIIAAQIITKMGTYYAIWPCAKIAYTIPNAQHLYPECASYFDGSNNNQVALVRAKFDGSAAEVGAALNVPFGTALWLALAIHAIGVEIYVSAPASG